MLYVVLKWKVTFQLYASVLKIENGFQNVKRCAIPPLKSNRFEKSGKKSVHKRDCTMAKILKKHIVPWEKLATDMKTFQVSRCYDSPHKHEPRAYHS